MRVQEIFSTIQGEGYWAGAACDFVRLYGCPVGCPWCDTGYADGGKYIKSESMTLSQIVSQATAPRITISGGEPFVQPDLPRLVQMFIDRGSSVAIETSGSFWRSVHDDAWVTLSPKQHVSPAYPVVNDMWERANEVKIVVSDGSELEVYASQLKRFEGLVYLQPEWTRKDTAIQAIMSIMAVHTDYRLSVQTHKFIGIP